jgi:3-oxoacyl-[acyl-carrier protein] reductase
VIWVGALEGKVALVTGGSSGIGKAISSKLAAEGATVILTFNANESGAAEAVAEITKSGGKAKAFRADVSRNGSLSGAVEYAKSLGGLDVLVNNAGITRDRTLKKMTESEWDEVIATNLKGAFNATAAALPAFRDGGRIVNISSVVGVCGNFGQANYAASKAGLIGFSKSLAKELASRGITVNAVAPGFVETGMTAAMGEELKARVAERIPLKRFARPDEIADAVAFVCMPSSGYITGAVLRIDGGLNL